MKWPRGLEQGAGAESNADNYAVLDVDVDIVSMTRPQRARSFLSDDEVDGQVHFYDLTVCEFKQKKMRVRICEAITAYNIWDSYGSGRWIERQRRHWAQAYDLSLNQYQRGRHLRGRWAFLDASDRLERTAAMSIACQAFLNRLFSCATYV
jgi:hypothetical protein